MSSAPRYEYRSPWKYIDYWVQILINLYPHHIFFHQAAVGRDLTSDVAVAEVRGAMQTLARSARWGSSKQKASSAAAAQATPPAVSAPGATTSGQRSL
jgi:hypothetical protein